MKFRVFMHHPFFVMQLMDVEYHRCGSHSLLLFFLWSAFLLYISYADFALLPLWMYDPLYGVSSFFLSRLKVLWQWPIFSSQIAPLYGCQPVYGSTANITLPRVPPTHLRIPNTFLPCCFPALKYLALKPGVGGWLAAEPP
jgi:hypothetical protein